MLGLLENSLGSLGLSSSAWTAPMAFTMPLIQAVILNSLVSTVATKGSAES
jgi:hypothetical protein